METILRKQLFDEYNPIGNTDIEKLINLLNIWRREGHITVNEAHREDELNEILEAILSVSELSSKELPSEELEGKIREEIYNAVLFGMGYVCGVHNLTMYKETREIEADEWMEKRMEVVFNMRKK